MPGGRRGQGQASGTGSRRGARNGPAVRGTIRRAGEEVFPDVPPAESGRSRRTPCRKYSGRIGRSASAKWLDEEAVRLAVIAHIRHRETKYDDLLAMGYDRHDARAVVRDHVERILKKWAGLDNSGENPLIELCKRYRNADWPDYADYLGCCRSRHNCMNRNPDNLRNLRLSVQTRFFTPLFIPE